jgi:ABC-2 type transport system permease protein
MLWPLRIALARLRPFGVNAILRIVIVALLFGGFILGDYVLFRRLFRAAAKIEETTPFFALALIQNFLELAFLVAFFVLFFSSLTAAIGSFFTDLDLDLHHSAPRRRIALLASRWLKTFIQSGYLVVAFLTPLFAALAAQYESGFAAIVESVVLLLLLMTAPVSAGSLVIVLLVRFFPVRRVHQIAATIGILFLTMVIVGVRVARPERLFTQISTDDVVEVLRQIELPAADRFPSSWLAAAAVASAEGEQDRQSIVRIALLAAVSLLLFLFVAHKTYFRAFVRAREDSAPVAIGAGLLTRLLDRLTGRLSPPIRALVRKEVRILTRDAAQWSQLFMMVALLFLYLYNIQMMPLEGDARALLLAYLNVGMAGFVVAAICLRFAYPSLSAEGKSFWLVETAPVTYRSLLWIKVLVFVGPLLAVDLILIGVANVILGATAEIWAYTMGGSLLMTATLVTLGVGMGALAPDFKTENPMEVALSLGGFAYMALSMIYVGLTMFLFARPVQRLFFRYAFGVMDDSNLVIRVTPIAAAIAVSLLLIVVPIEIAQRRLAMHAQN